MSSERLQKIIAAAGVASRRKAEELITAGRVTVNGEVKSELGSKADPETDDIRVDGKALRAEEHVYVLLHKPKGYVTTVDDPEGRPTVMDLVKAIPARVYPVGRLDYLSEGLLLLTNDGEMAAKLTHASTHVPKKYLVKVSGQPTEEQIQQLRDGVQLPAEQGNIHAAPSEGGKFGGEKRRSAPVKTAPAKIELSRAGDNPWYEVTLNEGRNRQIRRMFDFVGHHVEKIKRVEYGPLKLDVENGEFRLLSPAEVARLKQAAQGKHEPPRARDERPRPTRGGRGERPAFGRGRTGERAAFQKGSYKDRSDVESPREERTRTARFDADGKREKEAPRERPKFEKRERPAFRGPERDRAGSGRGERPFRGKPAVGGEFRGKSFGRSSERGGSRPTSAGRPKFGARPDRGKRGERPRTGGRSFERSGARSESRGERPFRGKPAAGSEFRGKSTGRPFSSGRPKFGPSEGRAERPFRGKPRSGAGFRGKRDERPASRGDRKEGGLGRDRRPGARPFTKKPGGFRKDFGQHSDRPVRDREAPRSRDFVDKTAKRFSGKLESGGRGPRGPRRSPGGGAPKRPFRKPKDKE